MYAIRSYYGSQILFRGIPSLPEDLDQYPLPPAAVELAVEDLLPGAEVEPAVRDRHHHLSYNFV